MNVLFLTSTLPRFDGDQQAPFVLEQATAWKKARPDDKLYILAPHDTGAQVTERINGVQINRFHYIRPSLLQSLAYPSIIPNLRRYPWRALQIPFFLWGQYRAAKKIIAENEIELVYAHWVMPQGVIAERLRQATGVPYVLQNHSSDVTFFEKFGRLGRAWAIKILKNAKILFCVNSMQSEAAQALLPGLHHFVLPMGVAMPLPNEARVLSQDEYSYAIGTISRLSQKKGLDYLIVAAEHLAQQHLLPKIAIAGDGEGREPLKALPQMSDVTFPGFLVGEEKLKFFDSCYAMVFPSVSANGDVEGLPVALLEAMAAGKPIIASYDTNITLLEEWSDISEAVELLEDPSDSTAFADAIKRTLALRPSDVARNARILKRTADRYRWENLIVEYLLVIDSVTQEKSVEK